MRWRNWWNSFLPPPEPPRLTLFGVGPPPPPPPDVIVENVESLPFNPPNVCVCPLPPAPTVIG